MEIGTIQIIFGKRNIFNQNQWKMAQFKWKMAQIKLYLANAILSTKINEKWHNLNEKWHSPDDYSVPRVLGYYISNIISMDLTKKSGFFFSW